MSHKHVGAIGKGRRRQLHLIAFPLRQCSVGRAHPANRSLPKDPKDTYTGMSARFQQRRGRLRRTRAARARSVTRVGSGAKAKPRNCTDSEERASSPDRKPRGPIGRREPQRGEPSQGWRSGLHGNVACVSSMRPPRVGGGDRATRTAISLPGGFSAGQRPVPARNRVISDTSVSSLHIHFLRNKASRVLPFRRCRLH